MLLSMVSGDLWSYDGVGGVTAWESNYLPINGGYRGTVTLDYGILESVVFNFNSVDMSLTKGVIILTVAALHL